MSDGPESVVPKEFLRQLKPLSEAEKQGGSAIVSSIDDAKKALNENNMRFPVLVIPFGARDFGEDFHVVNSEEELAEAVEEALPVSIGKKVHLVSRYPENLQSGRLSGGSLR